jgi:uncharacterized protein YlxP (DUF503 family)
MALSVGVCTLDLHLPEAGSLKSKRSILKSMLEGLRSRFNVSAAEVDHLDLWQRAAVGIACVSNSQQHNDEVLNKVVDWIEANPRVYVSRVEVEFF